MCLRKTMAVKMAIRKTNTYGKHLLRTSDKIMNGLGNEYFRKFFGIRDRISREFWCSHTGIGADGSG